MTPTADALKGLVGALRAIVGDGRTCISCGLPHAQCELHPGYCKPIIEARAALAAFESRGRLRDDAGLRTAVRLALPPGAELASTREILDAVEAHLFGPATPPTPEERER